MPEQLTADVAALETRLGRTLVAGDHGRAQAAIDDAWSLVESVAGRTWHVEGEDPGSPPRVIVTVVLAVARRAFENPEGMSQESIGSYSYSLATGTVPGVYLTAEERAMVRRAGGGSVRTVPVVRPGLTEAAAQSGGHVPTVYGADGRDGEPIPWTSGP